MEIESGIPIPNARRDTRYRFLYEMEVGQSVLVPTATLNINSLKGCRLYAFRRYGRKFTLRTLPEGKTRIWRVK